MHVIPSSNATINLLILVYPWLQSNSPHYIKISDVLLTPNHPIWQNARFFYCSLRYLADDFISCLTLHIIAKMGLIETGLLLPQGEKWLDDLVVAHKSHKWLLQPTNWPFLKEKYLSLAHSGASIQRKSHHSIVISPSSRLSTVIIGESLSNASTMLEKLMNKTLILKLTCMSFSSSLLLWPQYKAWLCDFTYYVSIQPHGTLWNWIVTSGDQPHGLQNILFSGYLCIISCPCTVKKWSGWVSFYIWLTFPYHMQCSLHTHFQLD